MVSLSSTSRARLFAASLLLLPVVAFSASPQRIRIPKIDSSFEMPDQKAEKPIVVDDATKAKLEELAKIYGKVARDNYPLIIKSLHLEKMPTVKPVKIVVTYKYNGVAATTGSGFGGERFGKAGGLDFGQRSGGRLDLESQALELPGEGGVLGRIAGDER